MLAFGTMPYELRLTEKGVYCHISGRFTGPELLELNTRLATLPNFCELQYQLLFFDNTTTFEASTQDIQTVARQDARLYVRNPNIKVAVVTGELVVVGLTNMYRAYAEIAGDEAVWPTRSFESDDEAYHWIRGTDSSGQ